MSNPTDQHRAQARAALEREDGRVARVAQAIAAAVEEECKALREERDEAVAGYERVNHKRALGTEEHGKTVVELVAARAALADAGSEARADRNDLANAHRRLDGRVSRNCSEGRGLLSLDGRLAYLLDSAPCREVLDAEARGEKLWGLLDDIDTLSDMLKERCEPGSFQDQALKMAAKRHRVLTSDGYTLRALTPVGQEPAPGAGETEVCKTCHGDETVDIEQADGGETLGVEPCPTCQPAAPGGGA